MWFFNTFTRLLHMIILCLKCHHLSEGVNVGRVKCYVIDEIFLDFFFFLSFTSWISHCNSPPPSSVILPHLSFSFIFLRREECKRSEERMMVGWFWVGNISWWNISLSFPFVFHPHFHSSYWQGHSFTHSLIHSFTHSLIHSFLS